MSGWTLEAYIEHVIALRAADQRVADERDRRYAEVATEREKALRVKEDGDRRALELARDIQSYKDAKDNQLREQINSERNLYATKEEVAAESARIEALLKPFAEWMATQSGRSHGIGTAGAVAAAVASLLIALLGVWIGAHTGTG